MPQIGEIKNATIIGLVGGNNYIWHACVDCGKERWVGLKKGEPVSKRCKVCSGRMNCKKLAEARPGRKRDTQGYVQLKIHPDDFFYLMAKQDGYVLEHRLVVARDLGRNLHRWEIVHHKNHIRDDNRIENLQLVSDDRHKQITILENRISYLEKQIEFQDKLITRIEKLERAGERLYHTYELLNIYIPRLTEVNIKYLQACTDYYFKMGRDVSKLRNILGILWDKEKPSGKQIELDSNESN